MSGTIYKFSFLQDHLRRKHPNVSMDVAPQPPTPVPAQQPSANTNIINFFGGKLPASSRRAQEISSSVLKFIVKDLRPFSVVENSGFKK